jgi:DNA-directed RNA polymerase sigma subunit (sigma70/sigma32)
MNTVSRIHSATLHQAVHALPPRAAQVIALLYGLWDGTPYPVRTVAKTLHLSEASVRRIEAEALRALRAHPALLPTVLGRGA